MKGEVVVWSLVAGKLCAITMTEFSNELNLTVAHTKDQTIGEVFFLLFFPDKARTSNPFKRKQKMVAARLSWLCWRPRNQPI